MLDWKHKTRKRLSYISHISRIPDGGDGHVQFGQWREWPNGTLFRYVYVPHVWLNPPVEEIPRCPDCGAEYEKTKELGGMIGFQPSCVARHDPDNRTRLSRGSD
jgi:hypothetical protein